MMSSHVLLPYDDYPNKSFRQHYFFVSRLLKPKGAQTVKQVLTWPVQNVKKHMSDECDTDKGVNDVELNGGVQEGWSWIPCNSCDSTV